ncbi:MAG TPA: hypothetical protein ENJ31_02750 [Anaerolineae bacterium]|nr:hypothetical protein [Anaerolineae bacterium]
MDTALILIILAAVWVFLLLYTFKAPAPKLSQLFSFVGLLVVSGLLFYVFLIKIVHYNPNPGRAKIAGLLTEDKLINLATVVPGMPDPLDNVLRLDTDGDAEEEIKEEWVVTYKYDIHEQEDGKRVGPFGATIYDFDRCRPPEIHSFELVPVNYDYLAEDKIEVTAKNIIEYKDPRSLDRQAMAIDRPEVIVKGTSRGIVTDLNIFRKVGWDENCVPRRTVRLSPQPMQVVTAPFTYENIGSFRGSHSVALEDNNVVTVKDRAGFERSQIVAYRKYTPKGNGSYFQPYQPLPEPSASWLLYPPVEVGLAFGPGQPDKTRQVYYPEKAVLAFFLQLGPDPDKALSYTCQGKGSAEYHPEDYGLTAPLADLQKVIVCELAYDPDVVGEQNHAPQRVRAKVVEVTKSNPDANGCEMARSVECTVAAAPNPNALPYGCEWCILECRSIP